MPDQNHNLIGDNFNNQNFTPPSSPPQSQGSRENADVDLMNSLNVQTNDNTISELPKLTPTAPETPDMSSQDNVGYKHDEFLQSVKEKKSLESTKILSQEVEETPVSIIENYYNNPQLDSTQNAQYYLDPNAADSSKSSLTFLFSGFLSLFKFGFDLIQVIVIAFAIFIVFYLFIVSPHTIDGKSMQPNFCNGDLILADKISPNFSPYKNGEVIVFVSNEGSDYIKRIVGVGGDRVRVQGGKVYRNGELLNEPYLNPSVVTLLTSSEGLREGVDYTVPNGKFLVFGDNRPGSTDSRKFLAIDPVGKNTIKGRVRVILWPPSHARIFDNTEAKPADFCLLQ